MKKKDLNETEICDRYITPALERAGWQQWQIRREYGFTDGKIIVRGKLTARGKKRRADYLLYYKPNIPIAVVEAKDNKHVLGNGMQQALTYARALDVPFAFSSNGDAFLRHDRSQTHINAEDVVPLDAFPSPQDLWARYKVWRRLHETDDDTPLTWPNHTEPGGKKPRYYQQIAINRTVEAVVKGQRRCLLVMATGTGKTYTAFNIIWRLWKSKVVRRVLFLADRNILVDQAIINDFRPFGGAMTKLNRKLVDPDSGKVNTSYEIYLGLYQAIVGAEPTNDSEGRESIYDKFPSDFFDLIVIDECHRGSAADDALWRQILDYFGSAVHLGMTATPKESKYVSNIQYFGEPVYQYSLKQGIDDGFLAPFKVIRVDLDQDVLGWRPAMGQTDDTGEEIDDRVYNRRDFDREIVFAQRTKLVAKTISQFLHGTNAMNKAIVFCVDIDHAERMRQALMNEPLNRKLVDKDDRYVVRITGDDKYGKSQLDPFINPKKVYPVIATTSMLMTTGVDAQTCHLIVIDRRIGSMTEFKQIIGRGTRLRTDYGKYYFTIMDFRQATQHFADPDWDGPPIQVYDPDGGDVVPPDPDDGGHLDDIEEVIDDGGLEPDEDDDLDRRKYRVGGQEFTIVAERVLYYNRDGRLITESLRDYTRKAVRAEFESLDRFLKLWNDADRKKVIVDQLVNNGVILEALEDLVGADYDPFDLICHVAFDQPPMTRKERANEVKKRDVFAKYGDAARSVLNALLDKYADQGIEHIEEISILKVPPLSALGTPLEIVKTFGGMTQYRRALQELEAALYDKAANG